MQQHKSDGKFAMIHDALHKQGKHRIVNAITFAINDFGWDQMRVMILEKYFVWDRHLLDSREQYFIRFYNSFKNGYNSDEGGKGCSKWGIPIIRWQIHRDVNPKEQEVTLKLYLSTATAAKVTGIDATSINKACKNFGRRSAGGFYWSYAYVFTMDFDTPIKVPRVGKIPKVIKPILSVHPIADGKAIEKWHESINGGACTLTQQSATTDNPKTFDQATIRLCLNGKRNHHKGVYFRRVTTEKREDFDEHAERESAFDPELYWTKHKKALKRKRDERDE